jgi:hypothetical protein
MIIREPRPEPAHRLPRALLLRAALIAAAYAVLHLARARPYVSLLSGTLHAPATEAQGTLILGVLYILAHIGFTVLTPVLVLAAGLVALYERVRERTEGSEA